MEHILGKSPLRLVARRSLVSKGVWSETLECGHEITTFQEFLWDEKSHLIMLEPTAKRRRCSECKELAQQIGPLGQSGEVRCLQNDGLPGQVSSPKKPVQSTSSKDNEEVA